MITTRRSLIAGLLLALAGGVAGCSEKKGATAPANYGTTEENAAVASSTELSALTPGSRPNVLVILADDLGYNDLGVFGSEINTPVIDRLAGSGLALTSYYTAPICAPTRSMLLSGTDHHRAGEGLMQVNMIDTPGYEGRLSERVVSVATRLKDVGYHTYMSGKWHLGDKEGQDPSAFGFDRSFVLLEGGASHFADMVGWMPGVKANYREDGKLVEALPEDFYSTDYYTDRMIDYIGQNAADGKPFFAYLAYTAPHWPVQAPDADLERQRGRYDEGYDVIRQRRFEAWKTAGFAPENAQLPELPPGYTPWDQLSDEEKAVSARSMEAYAAMVEHMDSQVGRLLAYLDEIGELDNTLVIFHSDNGAEGGTARFDPSMADNSVDNIGRRGSYARIGPGWAEAGSVPFHRFKYYSSEGGIRVPAIASGPGVPAGRSDALLMVSDLAPTALELAGADPNAYADREDVLPITGRSFVGLLGGDFDARDGDDIVGWEHGGNGAVRKGDWKLVWLGDNPIYLGSNIDFSKSHPMDGNPVPRERWTSGEPAGTPPGPGGPWKLYNVRQDPAELHDLSAEHPDIVAELRQAWDQYVAENGVVVKAGAQ